MSLLLTNARLIDPEAGTDVLGSLVIENGRISQIILDGESLPKGVEAIDCAGKCLAPGIIDIGCVFHRLRLASHLRYRIHRRILNG